MKKPVENEKESVVEQSRFEESELVRDEIRRNDGFIKLLLAHRRMLLPLLRYEEDVLRRAGYKIEAMK